MSMTLQLLHSEFPYIYEENLIFFFISVPFAFLLLERVMICCCVTEESRNK
jgi:hypothetical protein